MKTYFIILLLFTISYCDDDGYSAKSLYKDHIKANIIEDIACAGFKSVAIQMCIDETQDNRCEEAINQYITCSESSSARRAIRPRPKTQEEIEEEKKQLIESWTQSLYKEYFPKLIKKYSTDDALKQLVKIIDLVKKEIESQYQN